MDTSHVNTTYIVIIPDFHCRQVVLATAVQYYYYPVLQASNNLNILNN